MSEIKKIEINREAMEAAGDVVHLACPQCATETTHSRMKVIGPIAYPCGGCGAPWMGDKDIRRGVFEFWPPVNVGGEHGCWIPDVSPFILEPLEPAPPTAEDVARLWDRCAEAWKDAAVICGQEGDPASEATSEAYSLHAQAMADDTRYRGVVLAEARDIQTKARDALAVSAARMFGELDKDAVERKGE